MLSKNDHITSMYSNKFIISSIIFSYTKLNIAMLFLLSSSRINLISLQRYNTNLFPTVRYCIEYCHPIFEQILKIKLFLII